MPPSYMYQSPYLAATAPGSLVQLPATQLSHAAAVAAAATSQFYEYQNAAAVAAAAAAPYTGQYTNGFDAYTPYTGAASAASYMPYTYAALPQTPGIPTAATTTAFPGIQYQTAAQAPALQEARLHLLDEEISGIISVGNDLSQLLMSVILSYYTGRGHRPRWMALGMYTVVLFCIMTALPHFLYGPGLDALSLTKEFQLNDNSTSDSFLTEQSSFLCSSNHKNDTQCEEEGSNFSPQLILFAAQFISGIGGSLYYTLGVSYMDDNIKRSKTPALFSFSYFIRMLGPAIGHGLASICLKVYISPSLTPTIDTKDPRWLGAWWLGWIILALILFIFASLLAFFPKTLPRAAIRKEIKRQASRISNKPMEAEPETLPSFKDMIKTFRRLAANRTLMLNNFAAVFYFLGYMPYWIFLPKYIETQYRQSASASSLITGSAGLVFSAIGILISGLIISKFKPRARYLAAWNVIVGAVSVMGIISYAYLGCEENDNRAPVLPSGELNPISDCNSDCYCDYVKYNPVCSSDGTKTFVSACHAGCKKLIGINGTDVFADCSCLRQENKLVENRVNDINTPINWDFVRPGSCSVDCFSQFYMFLCVVCLLKFSGATGRAANFLVTVRCVEEKDKSVAMGFGLMLMSLCAFVPSPILFGIIMGKFQQQLVR
ncbi:hypothetical protein HUJ05_003086 [Dendroctonus ponderosae]|nr:hypothetical protein HUJ05_003086 [Dendroctonus ponderosae]